MGHAAQKDALGGKVNRPQFHMGFLEETIRIERDLEKPGEFGVRCRRNYRGGQGNQIRLDFKLLSENRISHGHSQNPTPVLFGRFHLGLTLRFITDELDTFFSRLPVIIL